MSDVGLDGAERLQVLRPLRDGFEVLRADVFDEERLFRLNHRSDEVGAISIDRHLLEDVHKRRLRRVRAGDLQPSEVARARP